MGAGRWWVCVWVVCVGCRAEPVEPVEPAPEVVEERGGALVVDRGVVRALRGYLHASYRVLWEAERGVDVEDAQAARVEALGRLRRALRTGGASAGEVEDEAGLIGLIGEAVRRGGRYAFVPSAVDDTFGLVRIVERDPGRRRELFEEVFTYELLVHDETLILDYSGWVLAQREGAARWARPATYRGDGVVLVDEAAIEGVARSAFLPRIEGLEARARAGAEEAAFVALGDPERFVELLALTKDVLRWRSLEGLWGRIRTLPEDEQVERFVEAYGDHAELRAAVELRELGAWGEVEEWGEEERARLVELGALSAVVHGDTLGQLADVVALTAASLVEEVPRPVALASRRIVAALVEALREGEVSAAGDARAFQRLAWGDVRGLRELAGRLYAERKAR